MRSRLLSPSTAKRALSTAVCIGERLIAKVADLPDGRGLDGSSGFALAFKSLADATGDDRYRQAAHDCLRQAARAVDKPSIGLFSGISGLRAVAALMSVQATQYLRLVGQCDAYVESALPSPDTATVSSFRDFDVISGWSGARLARSVNAASGSDRLLSLLEWLMNDDERWCRVHPLRKNDPPENDLGVAHGIAGMLAAVVLTTDPLESNHRSVLHRQASNLMLHTMRNGGRVLWPAFAGSHRLVEQRAWCYGTPGIAAALYWVGRRLSDSAIATFALDALAAECVTPPNAWAFWDHALCHGTLGCALIYASVGVASGDRRVLEVADALVKRVLEDIAKNEAACWGLAPEVSTPSLTGELVGAAGIALGLLTLGEASDSAWVRLHGLQPWD
jgi:lantibiotic modifying enzyme